METSWTLLLVLDQEDFHEPHTTNVHDTELRFYTSYMYAGLQHGAILWILYVLTACFLLIKKCLTHPLLLKDLS